MSKNEIVYIIGMVWFLILFPFFVLLLLRKEKFTKSSYFETLIALLSTVSILVAFSMGFVWPKELIWLLWLLFGFSFLEWFLARITIFKKSGTLRAIVKDPGLITMAVTNVIVFIFTGIFAQMAASLI